MTPTQRQLLIFSLAGGLAAACGGDDDPTPPTGSDTGGTTDVGGSDGGADVDTTPTPDPESLVVAYVREDTGGSRERQLVITDTDCRAGLAQLCEPGLCDEVVVEPRNESEPLCVNSCLVSPSLTHVVFADPSDAQTLRVAPMGSDYQLTADSEIVATDVREYNVGEGAVAYRTQDELFIYDLNAGTSTLVYTMTSEGAFRLSDDGATLFVSEVTSLSEMELTMVDVASGAAVPVFHFISGQEQGVGSFYSGREPLALSPDGSRLAVVTDALTAGAYCSSNADCSEPGATCLTTAVRPRCVRQELTMNVINMDASDRLRTACTADSECGADHFCDLTALDSDAAGECLPARFLLGPAGPRACETLQLGDYSGTRGGLAWRGDRTVVGVFEQSCVTGDIDVTDVVALNLDGAAFERIIENPEMNHGGCYDEVEQCIEASECVVEIDQAAVSMSGQTIALVADSPTSASKSELWLTDAFGAEGKVILTTDIFWDILSVSLHEEP